MYHRIVAILAFAVASLTGAAAAAPALEISSKVLVEKRVAAADGTTRVDLVAPQKVVPGDQVMFVVAYRNTGAQPITGVVLANPVPKGIAYRGVVPGTPAPELSVDGRTFGTLPTLRAATTAGGQRAATPDDVVAVRWRLATPVAAGASGQVAFLGAVR